MAVDLKKNIPGIRLERRCREKVEWDQKPFPAKQVV